MYRVVKEIRALCVFSSHDLAHDPPFSHVDLISCRNLLIYMESELQKKIIPLLHYALRPGGYLFLGSSETITRHSDLFRTIDKTHRIFQRKKTGAGLPPILASRAARGSSDIVRSRAKPPPRVASRSGIHG